MFFCMFERIILLNQSYSPTSQKSQLSQKNHFFYKVSCEYIVCNIRIYTIAYVYKTILILLLFSNKKLFLKSDIFATIAIIAIIA